MLNWLKTMAQTPPPKYNTGKHNIMDAIEQYIVLIAIDLKAIVLVKNDNGTIAHESIIIFNAITGYTVLKTILKVGIT
ncbi:hypothetical protein NLC92_27920 [Klebsiella pneumoniae]|nr:hypothetical protein [Klebsiella pneumoniae]MCP2569498.1 hypothetical protein [Klebsiella pneumoniae]MCQ1001613.1 hypothetical protein [Klebsiella pneumoniae]MCQ1007043.1 hypothetical protein [Klebsiella pneumoniae]